MMTGEPITRAVAGMEEEEWLKCPQCGSEDFIIESINGGPLRTYCICGKSLDCEQPGDRAMMRCNVNRCEGKSTWQRASFCTDCWESLTPAHREAILGARRESQAAELAAITAAKIALQEIYR